MSSVVVFLQLVFASFGAILRLVWWRNRRHPLITMQLCLVFVGVCSVGFAWFQSENRTEKLFIPQSSKAIDDLNTAEKFFRVKFREEIVLLVASSDDPNILAPECLKQAFEAHNAVIELESYSDFCVTLSGNKSKSPDDCVMINALEFVQFNESKLDGKNLKQVQQELDKAYNNTALMRNGRPFWYNFNRMFGDANRRHGSVSDAKALQMVYLIRDPSDEDENKKVFEWEKTFNDKLALLVDKPPCFEVHYSSEKSLDDAIDESSGSDIALVSVTFNLMIVFASVMLGKFLNPLTGHSLLANAGVFAVALGIASGFGLAMWFSVPFVSLVGVLPFLVLGIGLDDMFIIVDELDRQPRELSKIDTIKAVMKRSGATVTDLVAFAVSTSTSFPAIKARYMSQNPCMITTKTPTADVLVFDSFTTFIADVQKAFLVPLSTDSSADNSEVLPPHTFSLTPTIDFTSQSLADARDVFRQPAQTLTFSEGRQLTDCLLESIVKCMQIQNSLYRLVLLKLSQHAAGTEGQTDAVSGDTDASDLPEACHAECTRQNRTYDPGALLCDLKELLEALMRCADIQGGLFQRMIAVNLMTPGESSDLSDESLSSTHNQESPTVTGPSVNTLAVHTELEDIVFKTKVLCNHARNPFTSQQLKASSTEDVIQHVSEDKRSFSARAVNNGSVLLFRRFRRKRQKTMFSFLSVSEGKKWKQSKADSNFRGKRHGKGEGVILLLPCFNKPSTDDHGFYTGGWKNNMRHGSGKMTFVSGAVYEGHWQYDKMTGYGTLKFPDGSIQEGTWKEGSLDGRVLFTWPHGVTEYREYEQGRGQLSSCNIDEETAGKLSQMSSIRSQLSNLRECLTRLKEENLSLKDEMNILKTQEAEMAREYQANLCEIRQILSVQREQDCQKLREEFDKKLKDAETSSSKSAETIRELEKELEQAREAQLCQMCFERSRDCIIMPCTHLLYCRTCVTKHKQKGDPRCPACRGPISGEILCNVYQ